MADGITPLVEKARSIFAELGYVVSGEGAELRAERKWRVVRVTAVAEPDAPPRSGDLRCFVTWADHAAALSERLRRDDPDYEWAVIGVDDSGNYEVLRSPSGPAVPAR